MAAARCVAYTYLGLVGEDRPLGGIRDKAGFSERSVCTADVYRGRWEVDPSNTSVSALWDASQETLADILRRTPHHGVHMRVLRGKSVNITAKQSRTFRASPATHMIEATVKLLQTYGLIVKVSCTITKGPTVVLVRDGGDIQVFHDYSFT